MADPVTLFLISGKIAAGKSTLAAKLAAKPKTVLISEDHWLGHLFAEELNSLDDYARCSGQLKDALGPHVVALLREGVSVVMDFPANTPGQRRWLKGLFDEAGVAHELHFLDVPDDVCTDRLRARNAAGDHPFQVTEDQFHQVTAYFVPPTAEEGFRVIHHTGQNP